MTTAVDGANPHKLVSMLFDALQSEIIAARGAIARGEPINSDISTLENPAIVDQLRGDL